MSPIYVVLLSISYEGLHIYPDKARWFSDEREAQAYADALNKLEELSGLGAEHVVCPIQPG